MRLSIIVPDKAVYKDYEVYLDLNWAGTPANVFALQWLDDSGHIEFNDGTTNEIISALPTWTNNALAAWQIASDDPDITS